MRHKIPLAIGLFACVLVSVYLQRMSVSDIITNVRPRPKIRPEIGQRQETGSCGDPNQQNRPEVRSIPAIRQEQASMIPKAIGSLAYHKGKQLETTALKTRAIAVGKECSGMFGPDLHQTDMGRRPLSQLLVNDKYRLIFCYIPKVASSNLKRLFLVLGNFTKKRNPSELTAREVNSNFTKVKKLNSFPKSGRLYRLRSYTKVVSTREPFERLISAYRSKFQSNHSGSSPWAVEMKQTILTNLSIDGQHLPFAKFIQFLVQEKSKVPSWNFHWATYTDLCDPCHVGYDYVANFDTIDTDMRLLMEYLGADVEFPKRQDNYFNATLASKNQLEAYYKTVPPEHIEDLKKIFSTDARLFGYTFPDVLSKLVG